MALDSKIPEGPLEEKWDNHKFDIKLVNPANKRRFDIIVVGTGLAGASAAASLAELGYSVKVVTFHDSPRRAHSIAAQGGINAAKNYKNDGDSVYRLFYDTIKGGDYRSRGQRVPPRAGVGRHHRPVRRPGRAVRARVRRPARQPLVRWRAGVAHVLRTGPDRSAAPARRVPGAHARGALVRRAALPPHRDARRRRQGRPDRRHRVPRPQHRRSVLDGGSRGRARDGRLRQRFYLSTNAEELERHRGVARGEEGRVLRQPVLHADPPHVHPGERRVPEQAHADVGVVAQRRPGLDPEEDGRRRDRPTRFPKPTATTSSSAAIPPSATSCARRRVARDQARGRRGPRRRAAEERRVPRLHRIDRTGSGTTSSRSATATSSRCTTASPARIRTSCRCASTPRSTTRWAGSGSTTT